MKTTRNFFVLARALVSDVMTLCWCD